MPEVRSLYIPGDVKQDVDGGGQARETNGQGSHQIEKEGSQNAKKSQAGCDEKRAPKKKKKRSGEQKWNQRSQGDALQGTIEIPVTVLFHQVALR